MALFLGISVALSLILILIGFRMDRSAIKARINGANGLPVLAALVVSFLASLGIAAVAGIFGGWAMFGWVILFTLPYHIALGALVIWRLQRLASRTAADRR